MGMNILWNGWNKAYQEVKWTHLECIGSEYQWLYRRMLRWDDKLLKVPTSISAFSKIVTKAASMYMEINSKQLSFSEVKVEKIALPKTPPEIIPLLTILPKEVAKKYAIEENFVSKNPEKWEQMNNIKIQLGMKKSEYIEVIRKLWQLKMIDIRPIDEIKVINGIQCVSKPDGKQRLIFDGRRVNMVFEEPEKVKLPDFSLVTDWVAHKDEQLRFGKLDIDNFYHRLGVPGWMINYLGLPEIEGEWIGRKRGRMCPVCLTLPMGLAHAVLLAQEAHLFMIRNISIAPLINTRIREENKLWILVYIDDVIVAAKERSGKMAEEAVNTVLIEILTAYQKVGLPVNREKIQQASNAMTGLGCLLTNKYRGIQPKNEKMREVVAATKLLLQCERASKKAVETLLGYWIWFFLLNRPLYSIFFHIYRWLHKEEGEITKNIWVSVKRELYLAILFADRCFLSWERDKDEMIIATDASSVGAGACEISMQELKDISFEELNDQNLLGKNWRPILNQRWLRREHINILELRALLMAATEWLICPQHLHTKWTILIDSKVIHGAIQKGRSSAYMLCCLLRRVMAICIRMDATLSTRRRRYRGSYRRLTLGLAPSTIKQYAAVIQKYRITVGKIKFEDLDSQLLDYIQVIPTLAQKSTLEKLMAAFKHFFPECAEKLPRTKRFTKQLQRQHRGITKPPMILDVVLLLMMKLIEMDFPTTAVAVYLQFDCFLRPVELCSIVAKHVAFPGGAVLGFQAQKVLILLPTTKTGPLQSVRVESTLVQQLLRRLVEGVERDTKLFPSYYVYSRRIARALELLGLAYVGYTPHSIRHGAATMALINGGEKALPGIMYRGRWESSAGKAYLQMGAAALLFAELPEYLIGRAKTLVEEMPKIFQQLALLPTI